MRFRIARASFALCLLSAALVFGQTPAKKPLTLERVANDTAGGDAPLVSRGAFQTAWRDPRHLTYLLAEGSPDARPVLYEYDVETRKTTKLVLPLSVPTDTAAAPSSEKEATPKTLPLRGALFSPDGKQLLLSGEDDLFAYDLDKKALRRLTRDDDEEEYPVFSPDGARVSYVKRNDLYAIELASGKEKRLTNAGSAHVFNGKLDWVYEEELASRRSGRSYEWAPDSSAIVYLRLDETRVPEYPIVDFLPTNGKLQPQRYPKAGDPNSVASVHMVDMSGRETGALLLNPDQGYVGPEFSWTADSKSACVVLLNRAQDELSLVLVPRDGASLATTKLLLVEKDAAWINSIEPPTFLKDGSGFVFLSERSGFLHLYRHAMDGKLKNAVTSGSWMIDRSPEIDEKSGWVTFTATEKDPRERHVYRVKLDGTGLKRLSEGRGVHSIDASPDHAFYTDRSSDIVTPPKLTLHRADGTSVAVVDAPANTLEKYTIGTTELGSFKGSEGTLFYTRLVKPADFDPSKKYPVVVFVYGGPHAQVVQDRWGATSMFDFLMAQKGYLVWSIDNRGSWGRGHAFETPILKKMGQTELKDQLEGIAELKKLPFVDPARIGMSGWSYGGYLTAYAATHAGEVFKCAVAGAPVTDWKFYDTIYTERYMKLPKDNPEGYRASAPLSAAANLGTKLLILHGTSDDNVHMQNSFAFIDALMRAQKDFAFVPLPRQKHGPRDPAARLYADRRILEFFEKNL